MNNNLKHKSRKRGVKNNNNVFITTTFYRFWKLRLFFVTEEKKTNQGSLLKIGYACDK